MRYQLHAAHPFACTLALVFVESTLSAKLLPAAGQPIANPAPGRGDAGLNVWVMALEVTQATQPWLAIAGRSRNASTPEVSASEEMMPLVRGKRTVARVYPGVEGGTAAITGVEAVLSCQTGDDAPCPGPAAIRPAAPIRVDPRINHDIEALQRDVARTWNFVLPEAWTTMAQPIKLTAAISTPRAAPECPSCQDGANGLTLSGLMFHSTAPLELRVVYACVRRNPDDPPSVCDHVPMNLQEGLFRSGESLIVKTFPVAERDFRLTLNDPITLPVDGDFSLPGAPMTPERTSAFKRLVCGLAGQAAGGAGVPANVITIGIFPDPVEGIVGLGESNCLVARAYHPDEWPALRVAATFAHELGHGLGRPHAGCGVHPPGEPPPCDPYPQVFPCPHGGICATGFDTYALQAIEPGDPPDGYHVHDFMSYGGGVQQWISPFTYRRLFDILRALLPAAQSSR